MIPGIHDDKEYCNMLCLDSSLLTLIIKNMFYSRMLLPLFYGGISQNVFFTLLSIGCYHRYLSEQISQTFSYALPSPRSGKVVIYHVNCLCKKGHWDITFVIICSLTNAQIIQALLEHRSSANPKATSDQHAKIPGKFNSQ